MREKLLNFLIYFYWLLAQLWFKCLLYASLIPLAVYIFMVNPFLGIAIAAITLEVWVHEWIERYISVGHLTLLLIGSLTFVALLSISWYLAEAIVLLIPLAFMDELYKLVGFLIQAIAHTDGKVRYVTGDVVEDGPLPLI